MNAAIKQPNDFLVKDLALADWGRKEIKIAETEMPGLMAIRNEFAAQHIMLHCGARCMPAELFRHLLCPRPQDASPVMLSKAAARQPPSMDSSAAIIPANEARA